MVCGLVCELVWTVVDGLWGCVNLFGRLLMVCGVALLAELHFTLGHIPTMFS